MCGGYCLEVRDEDQGLHCDICQRWLHAQCKNISAGLYRDLQKSAKPVLVVGGGPAWSATQLGQELSVRLLSADLT